MNDAYVNPHLPQPQGHTGASLLHPPNPVSQRVLREKDLVHDGGMGCISDEGGHLSTPSEGDAG